jgi:hypothetical protein
MGFKMLANIKEKIKIKILELLAKCLCKKIDMFIVDCYNLEHYLKK